MNPDIDTLTDPPEPSVQRDDPLTLLRRLLAVVDTEAEVKPVTEREAEVNGCGWVKDGGEWIRPSHAVFTCEGDLLGRGLSEGAAIADAIRRAYRDAEETIEQYRSTIRNYKTARAALDNL